MLDASAGSTPTSFAIKVIELRFSRIPEIYKSTWRPRGDDFPASAFHTNELNLKVVLAQGVASIRY